MLLNWKIIGQNGGGRTSRRDFMLAFQVVWTLHLVMHFPTFGHNRQPVWLQAKTWYWHVYFSDTDCVLLCKQRYPSVFSFLRWI